MEIQFKNIIPHPLKETFIPGSSSIWGMDHLTLKNSDKLLIKAPSGKGKSTFLNILFGIRKDFDGELQIDGELASKTNWDATRKSSMSMVFQGLELFDHLNALENILLKNDLTNHKSKGDILEMMSILGIEKLANQQASTLSFGQKQRVAVIRALCQPYKWLFLDEPFSHLDEENSKQALDLIMTESTAKNAGVIITSLGAVYSDYFTKSLVL